MILSKERRVDEKWWEEDGDEADKKDPDTAEKMASEVVFFSLLFSQSGSHFMAGDNGILCFIYQNVFF